MSVGSCIDCGEGRATYLQKYCEPCYEARHPNSPALNSRQPAPLPATAGEAARHWPAPLTDDAYHGIVGDLVRVIEPHTEADPNAILISFLVGFGNLVGRSGHWRAGAEVHHTNLYALLVGDTSTGRKGTAVNEAMRVLKMVDPDWLTNRKISGLSSGEGLIKWVRDPVIEQGEDGPVEVDPGEPDKRLLVVESEFARALKLMRQERNILSATIRTLWDDGSGGSITKGSPTRTTAAHVSIIGAVTPSELARQLDDVEIANGFANRFLLVATRRSKLLPEGGNLDDHDLEDFANDLRLISNMARVAGGLPFTDGARELWRFEYERLTSGRPGILGAVVARAAPQVRRLAVVYALLDGDGNVSLEHLRAALEVWRYCEDSARHVFGDATGNKLADKLREHLRAAGPSGMSRSMIRTTAVGSNSTPAGAIDAALRVLADQGLASAVQVPTGGRPTETWYSQEICEVREESPDVYSHPSHSSQQGGSR